MVGKQPHVSLAFIATNHLFANVALFFLARIVRQ